MSVETTTPEKPSEKPTKVKLTKEQKEFIKELARDIRNQAINVKNDISLSDFLKSDPQNIDRKELDKDGKHLMPKSLRPNWGASEDSSPILKKAGSLLRDNRVTLKIPKLDKKIRFYGDQSGITRELTTAIKNMTQEERENLRKLIPTEEEAKDGKELGTKGRKIIENVVKWCDDHKSAKMVLLNKAPVGNSLMAGVQIAGVMALSMSETMISGGVAQLAAATAIVSKALGVGKRSSKHIETDNKGSFVLRNILAGYLDIEESDVKLQHVYRGPLNEKVRSKEPQPKEGQFINKEELYHNSVREVQTYQCILTDAGNKNFPEILKSATITVAADTKPNASVSGNPSQRSWKEELNNYMTLSLESLSGLTAPLTPPKPGAGKTTPPPVKAF